MAGLAAVAKPLVTLLLTEKWLVTAPYLVLLSVSYATYPIHSINLQVMNAMGRSDLCLKLELIKKTLGILILVLSLPFGIGPMLLWKVLDEYLCTFINAWPNRRLIAYGPLRQWIDVLPSALISIVMGVVVYLLQNLSLGALPLLLLQILVGVLVYLGLSLLLNREPLQYIYGLAAGHTTSSL